MLKCFSHYWMKYDLNLGNQIASSNEYSKMRIVFTRIYVFSSLLSKIKLGLQENRVKIVYLSVERYRWMIFLPYSHRFKKDVEENNYEVLWESIKMAAWKMLSISRFYKSLDIFWRRSLNHEYFKNGGYPRIRITIK